MSPLNRILVFAPNWLGDAVMSLPSVALIRAQWPEATLAVAARGPLASLYEMVDGVDEVSSLQPAGRLGGWLAALRDARRLRAGRFDVAILLPNSFRSAWIARRAGIAGRWGYATDARTALLTRTVERVRGVHQVEYYERLLEGLEIGTRSEGPKVRGSDILRIPAAARQWARETLHAAGWTGGEPLVGMAPGAAYGGAKQWPPERFAQLAIELAQRPARVRTVLVGSAGDRAACDRIVGSPDLIDLCGRTDLKQLAAVMAECRAFVSNDSGAMHLASAVGVPVVAIFGSTNEKETSPLGDHVIVTTDVSCRPCMLRECPIENHPCMTGIDVERVRDAVFAKL